MGKCILNREPITPPQQGGGRVREFSTFSHLFDRCHDKISSNIIKEGYNKAKKLGLVNENNYLEMDWEGLVGGFKGFNSLCCLNDCFNLV